MTAAAGVGLDILVTIHVPQTVLLTHVPHMMDLVNAMKDIMVYVVKIPATIHAKTVTMILSVNCVLLVDTDPYVLWFVTVTAARVIS